MGLFQSHVPTIHPGIRPSWTAVISSRMRNVGHRHAKSEGPLARQWRGFFRAVPILVLPLKLKKLAVDGCLRWMRSAGLLTPRHIARHPLGGVRGQRSHLICVDVIADGLQPFKNPLPLGPVQLP